MEKKLFLIDGHSLIFRMYYAFLRHPMVNSKGEDVSILYGFTRYLLELVQKYSPTHMAVCFDPPGKTFRHLLYPQYKGTRQATPELVIAALEPLIDICRALGLPVLMVSGFEGDDVLGSMAVRSAAEGMSVYMVTPDKDFGQLVSERISQLRPGKSGGEDEILTPSALCAKLGISAPRQVIDMLAICGDTADNVPGVSGVGEVGAAKLIARYGSLKGIYDHLEELSERQRGLFEAARDHMDLSYTLVTIKTDISLDVAQDDMLLRGEHDAAAAALFDRYEFPSLKKMLRFKEGPSVAASSESDESGLHPVIMDVTPERLSAAAAASKLVALTVDWTEPLRITAAAALAGDYGSPAAAALAGSEPQAGDKPVANEFSVACGTAEDFAAILSDASIVKTGYDLKQLYRILSNDLQGRLDDIALMHYLLDPEQSHKVEVLGRRYLNLNVEQAAQKEGTVSQEKPQEQPGLFDMPTDSDDDAGGTTLKDRRLETVAVLLLQGKLREELRSHDMERLYDDMEEPLQRVLARMEKAGVKVDMAPLREFASTLRSDMDALENKVREELSLPSLNISSPRQVGQALYEQLRVDPRRKPDSRGNYPTDEETLTGYAEQYPVIYDILEYRGVKKLLGTYIEPFGQWISPLDGRIHTTFNQALTATGRLSSSRPNLQNIPVRTDRGRQIRKAFVASGPDNVIVSADYSQIELRLMAHFCADAHMLDAFAKDLDVHAITASKIYGVALENVTEDMRRTAKTANFGIMYGISAFGLAQRLKIPRVAAKKLIEDYFANFPSIRNWIDSTVACASEKGYVQTLFGRRRYLPDINSRNATTRALAARNAVNAPIQGTAADIIKIAMNRVDGRLRSEGLRSTMVLQIHDELVFDAPRGEVDSLMEIIRDSMENVISLSVPLKVECNYGDNWLEAH